MLLHILLNNTKQEIQNALSVDYLHISKINNLSLINFNFIHYYIHKKNLSHKEVRKAFVYHYSHILLCTTLTSC